MRLNPKKIATKHFFALTALMGHGESQKKSPGSSDPGNRVNLHIFKMAAIENLVRSSNRYTADTPVRIFTLNTSNDVVPCKEVPFRGYKNKI